jgi:hypothetical protein
VEKKVTFTADTAMWVEPILTPANMLIFFILVLWDGLKIHWEPVFGMICTGAWCLIIPLIQFHSLSTGAQCLIIPLIQFHSLNPNLSEQPFSNHLSIFLGVFLLHNLYSLPRDYWMIYRRPGFLAAIWFSSSLNHLSPSPISKLSLFLCLPVCRRSSFLAGGRRGEVVANGHISAKLSWSFETIDKIWSFQSKKIFLFSL